MMSWGNAITRPLCSHLVKYEPHVSLLAQASSQTIHDLKAERLVGHSVVPTVDVHVHLRRKAQVSSGRWRPGAPTTRGLIKRPTGLQTSSAAGRI